MKVPKINLRVILALVAIFGVVYVAYNSIQEHSYSGQELNFSTSGIINIDNPSGEMIMVSAVSPQTFTLSMNNPTQQNLRATREGSGRSARYVVQAEIATSVLDVNVIRGTSVDFTIVTDGNAVLNAIVAARPANENRDIVLVATAISLGLLIFISFQTEHYLLKRVKSFLPILPMNRMKKASV